MVQVIEKPATTLSTAYRKYFVNLYHSSNQTRSCIGQQESARIFEALLKTKTF